MTSLDNKFTTASFGEMSTALEAALCEAAARGAPSQATRWSHYLRAIAEAIPLVEDPEAGSRWMGDRERQRIFWEACNQAQQLVHSRPLWETVNERALTLLLKAIMGGAVITANDERDDARNRLFELTAAASLFRQGVAVELTEEDEDFSARIVGIDEPFAVECKRPQTLKSLKSAVEKAREQCKKRRRSGYQHCIVVLAADRLTGLAHGLKSVKTQSALQPTALAQLRALRDRASELVRSHYSCKLYPMAPVGVALLVGAVMIEDTTTLCSLNQMAVFSTGSSTSRQFQQLLPHLQDSFGRGGSS